MDNQWTCVHNPYKTQARRVAPQDLYSREFQQGLET